MKDRTHNAYSAARSWPWLILVPLLAGCGQNALTLNRQNQSLLAQQQSLASRSNELQTRAGTLDRDNQELEGLLAQSRQQIQILKDELSVVREQLNTSTSKLAAIRQENQGLGKQTESLTASLQRREGATIRPNNSLIGRLTAVHIPGVEVRQDGDVIRIELPGDKLFIQGSAAFQGNANQVMDAAMADVLQNYPNQIIGIEGHTDSDPIRTPQFPSNHHLAAARAMAVFDHVQTRFRLPPQQVFVVGHGANHPVVSNGSPDGKARNRRVELVVYPETYPR